MDIAKPISLTDQPHWIDKSLGRAIEDSRELLRYAAQRGIVVDEPTVAALVQAEACLRAGDMPETVTVRFYAAATKLAALTAPVSAASLPASAAAVGADITRKAKWSVALALLVVLFSGVTFITGMMAQDIDADTALGNDLAVKLRSQFIVGTVALPVAANGGRAAGFCTPTTSATQAPDKQAAGSDQVSSIKELQEFAADIRALLRTASKLDWFVFNWEISLLDPKYGPRDWQGDGVAHARLELDPALADMPHETFCKISTYEDVRAFALSVRDDSRAVYGALSGYLLPVLYALLGSFAYNLRDFSDRVKRQSFIVIPHGDMARNIAAVTAGAIISLFANFTQGSPLSPLAAAFLVGYGVEIFYAFLDTLLTTFAGRRQNEAAAPTK